jgi:hypothetical protein
MRPLALHPGMVMTNDCLFRGKLLRAIYHLLVNKAAIEDTSMLCLLSSCHPATSFLSMKAGKR